MISTVVGQLTKDKTIDEWWNSDPVEIPYFNNLKLKYVFTEADDKKYFELADKAISEFFKLTQIDRKNQSKLIEDNYAANLIFDYTPKLKLDNIEDIWNYVYPTGILISWDENDNIYLLINCECEWEQEHGLQLVFKNGQNLTRVSYIDGDFTDD